MKVLRYVTFACDAAGFCPAAGYDRAAPLESRVEQPAPAVDDRSAPNLRRTKRR